LKYRKLRIAWSVMWGAAAVLLVVLWVWSYWQGGEVTYRNESITEGNAEVGLQSVRGRLLFYWDTDHNPPFRIGWFRQTFVAEEPPMPVFVWHNSPNSKYIEVPYWFGVAILAAISALPLTNRFRFGFSLRTLLIGTTLVAILLGVVVCASK
jgi:hypothetical protein